MIGWIIAGIVGLALLHKKNARHGLTRTNRQPSQKGLPLPKGAYVWAAQPQIEAANVVQQTAPIVWKPATVVTPDIGMAQAYLGPAVNDPVLIDGVQPTSSRTLSPSDSTAITFPDRIVNSVGMEITGGVIQGDVL